MRYQHFRTGTRARGGEGCSTGVENDCVDGAAGGLMETCPFPRLGQSLCLGRGKPEEGERKQWAEPRWLFRQAAAFRLSDDL